MYTVILPSQTPKTSTSKVPDITTENRKLVIYQLIAAKYLGLILQENDCSC